MSVLNSHMALSFKSHIRFVTRKNQWDLKFVFFSCCFFRSFSFLFCVFSWRKEVTEITWGWINYDIIIFLLVFFFEPYLSVTVETHTQTQLIWWVRLSGLVIDPCTWWACGPSGIKPQRTLVHLHQLIQQPDLM